MKEVTTETNCIPELWDNNDFSVWSEVFKTISVCYVCNETKGIIITLVL